MTPPGEFPNNSAQPHLALWLDSPVVQSGLALRLDLRDLRKAHFLKPIWNGFRPRVYLVLAYARHSTVASPLGPAAAGLLITLIATGGGFKPGSSAMLPRSANLSCRNLSLPWQGGWHDSKGGTCEAKRLTRAKT